MKSTNTTNKNVKGGSTKPSKLAAKSSKPGTKTNCERIGASNTQEKTGASKTQGKTGASNTHKNSGKKACKNSQESETDPDGSYTGNPAGWGEYQQPVQDADDL